MSPSSGGQAGATGPPAPTPEALAFRESLGGVFPDHVAIIMDGNGRWAQERGWVRVRGHKEGTESVREITTIAAELGCKSLTLYAFSRENWKRPDFEVSTLMRLLRLYLRRELRTLMDNGIRLVAIGRLSDLPEYAQRALRETMEKTAGNTGMVLRLALSYGGRTEVADALRAFSEEVAAGRRRPDEVNEETLRDYLYDPGTADPDLIIRTAGEMRLSNFLLWQASYAEFYVTEDCWPDFRRPQFEAALRAFAARKRKFGALPADADEPAGLEGLDDVLEGAPEHSEGGS
ncbi:MAG: polyprenyl diphosphate synthase [Planctomycetota bacterium]|nr:polyprenyl diphosphate synthase [Planctomycetota bacterium]MDG1986284.1 polyprenyl diphosphate synthase [Planctomycetota bacterium]